MPKGLLVIAKSETTYEVRAPYVSPSYVDTIQRAQRVAEYVFDNNNTPKVFIWRVETDYNEENLTIKQTKTIITVLERD